MRSVPFLRWLLVAVTMLTASISHAQMLQDESLADLGVGWSRTWVDVDGDGRDDFCYLTGTYEKDLVCRLNKQAGAETKTYPDLWQGRYAAQGGSMRWVDINGDGFVDVCRAVELSTSRLACRLGPTLQTGFELPWVRVQSYEVCSSPGTAAGNCIESGGQLVPQMDPGIAVVDSVPDFHLADVNGDGIPDLCYLYQVSFTQTDLRCRIAVVSNGRTTVTYGPETPAWTLPNISKGAEKWPQGFYDFNGDGFADYCRVLPGGVLRCALSTRNGFASAEVSSRGAVAVPYLEGAAFVDINGDGNIDFCRLVGSSNNYSIRCTLSNGVDWEFGDAVGNTRELVSPAFSDPGNPYSRWWVDVNGDGLPDFCRLASAPDPFAASSTGDPVGHLLCLLSRGDGVSAANPAFAFSDVTVQSINLGRPDGGRAFCDPIGTGIPTFCRATFRSLATSEQVCQETQDGPACYPAYQVMQGFLAGYPTVAVPARHAVLNAFSDGVGAETRVTYMPLSNAQVYMRSNTTSNVDDRILLVQPRAPVVFETRAWVLDSGTTNPTALTGLARYFYKDLRTDVQAGSLGFRERWIFHEGANTLDHVVFYQGLGPTVDAGSVKNDLREVGSVKCQEKLAVRSGLVPTPSNVPNNLSPRNGRLFALRAAIPKMPNTGPCSALDAEPTADNPFVLLQATVNTLGETSPANPRLKFVNSATTRSWDWNGSVRVALPRSVTTTTMSDLGNVYTVDQSTIDAAGPPWRKLTTNEFGAENVPLWLLGRLTRSSVKTYTPDANAQLAARAPFVGTSPNAGLMQDPGHPPPPPPPLSPAVLSVILQLLLED